MTKKYRWKNYRLISLLLILFVLIGCGKNPKKPNPKTKEGNSPKLPKVLTELENDVLKTMYDLDSISGIEKAIDKEKLIETEKKEKEKETSSVETAAKPAKNTPPTESKPAKKEEKKKPEEKINMHELIMKNKIIIPLLEASDVKGSFAEGAKPPENIDKVWTKISESVTEVHKKWNALESQLVLGKVPQSKAEDFEKILDDLTLSVMNKDKLNSLKLANDLTRITANFRSYFDGVANHGVYGMYYHIRATILLAASDNYAGAIEHLNETSKIGDSLRQDLIKQKSEEILQKFELSIEDLRKQLINEDFHLSQIKAPIVIKNIKLMEDVFKKQKSK